MMLAAVQNKHCGCCLLSEHAIATGPAHAPIRPWLTHDSQLHSLSPPLFYLPLPAATEDYDFVFAENGLEAYREGNLLAVQSLRKQLAEAKLKVRDSNLAQLAQTFVASKARPRG